MKCSGTRNESSIALDEWRTKMKRSIEFKATSSVRSLLGLTICLALSIACQESHSSNSPAPKPSEERSTAQAPSTNDQPVTANPPLNDPQVKNDSKPGIQITEVPPKGAGERLETIAGTVTGANIEECKVVIFARTNTWYVQPWVHDYETKINEDKTWRNDTHLGYQYAALLVKKGRKFPATTGRLPDVGGEILAISIVNAKE